MKSVLLWFFTIALLIQGTQSIWISLAFVIQRDYIANELCINRFEEIPTCGGQCYLQEQMEAEQERNDGTQGTQKQDNASFFCDVLPVGFAFRGDFKQRDFLALPPNPYFLQLIKKHFHPPCLQA